MLTDAPGREDEDDFLYGAPTVSPGTSNTPAPVSETPAGPIEGKTYRISCCSPPNDNNLPFHLRDLVSQP